MQNRIFARTLLNNINWRVVANCPCIYLLFSTLLRILSPIKYMVNNKEQLIVLVSAIYSPRSRIYADNKIVLLVIAPQSQQINGTQMVAKISNSGGSTDHLWTTFAFRQASPTIKKCHWLAYIAAIDSLPKPQTLQIGKWRHKITNVEVKHSYIKKRVQVGACFSPLFFMEHWQLLVLTIEIYRHFGVSLQIIYLMSALEGIFDLLKQYNASDVIQMEPWYSFNLEGQQYNESVPNPNLEMEWRSQTTAHTHCLLKYGYAAEFLIVGDLDDILIPDHGTYYEDFLLFNVSHAVNFLYNRLHTEITTAINPANFSLLNTIMSAKVSPQIPLLQKSVVNTTLTEALWIHLPYIIRPFAIFCEVPTKKGRMFHIREWHFVEDDSHVAAAKVEESMPFNASSSFINSSSANQINQRFKSMTLKRTAKDTFHKLPTKMHYAHQFVNCYRKVEHAQNTKNVTECPGPHRCEIKPIVGLKCVVSRRNFSAIELAPRMLLYTSPVTEEHFQISDSGCTF